MKTIYDVFYDAGIAGRRDMCFADNYSRVFTITITGNIIAVQVRTGDGSLVPDGVTALHGEFIFDLNDKTTNATSEQIKEIQRWVDTREMPGLGALAIAGK